MEAQEFEGAQLRYLTVHPDGYDPNKRYPMVIMLHGFGANMQDLAGLAPVIDTTGLRVRVSQRARGVGAVAGLPRL